LHRVVASDRDRRHPRSLRRRVTERLGKLKVDDALANGTDIGPWSTRAIKQDLDYIVGKGGATLLRRQVLGRAKRGHYLAPALLTGATNPRLAREIFGPVASVIGQGLRRSWRRHHTDFGLSAGIVTTRSRRVAFQARYAGMVMVNLPTAGVDYHVPFGGRKARATACASEAAKEFSPW
jgi:aldehyde dehydrogenase (NAD+)